MAAALQRGEHPQRVGLILRLAQTLVIQKYHGVGGDDDLLRGAELGGGIRLFPGDVFHDLRRGETRRVVLVRLGHPDVKIRDADAVQ